MINTTLVTIHGFWSSPTTWEQLSEIWNTDEQLQGVRIHPFGYSSPKRPRLPFSVTRIPDYDDIAQTLATEYMVALAGAADVAIVTHSQGGLILQRFLTWMLQQGRGRELARIRTIVMLACPNGGSEYLQSIRHILRFGRHAQAGSLEVLSKPVADTHRTVLQRIVNATGVDEHQCRIPFHVYAGSSDKVVTAASAQGAFPGASVLAGNHFSILDPTSPGNLTAETVKHHLLSDLPAGPAQFSRQIPAASDTLSGSASVLLATEPTALPSDGLGALRALARDLITDVDMLADSQSEAEILARHVAEEHEDADLSSLLRQMATALGGDTGQVIRRRLMWFGRQLLRSADAQLTGWSLEESVKAAPQGMAVLLTDPAVWASCPAGARRRCLTALLGPPDNPNAAKPLAIQLLAPLLRAGVVSGDEAARVQASFDLATLDQLIANGATFDMLVPRILTELDSHVFVRQNTVAWFLCDLSPAVRDQPLEQELDFSLGAKLTDAATGVNPSYGARDAMAWKYVSTWPPARIAGGIWAAVSYVDGQHLRTPASEHLSTLIAAAHGKDLLREILEFVRYSLDQSLERISGGLAQASDDVLKLAGEYTGSDQQHLTSFGDWLRSRYTGE